MWSENEQSISKTHKQAMSWLQEVEQRSDGKSQVRLGVVRTE